MLFANKEMIIDLTTQKIYAYEDGKIILEGRISSGKRGYETPTGEFKILQKKRHHKSNLWPKPDGGAKMPYMMRLTNTGIAMHQGHVPKKPASHGCIRLQKYMAKKMFYWASVGTMVTIEGDISRYYDSSQYSTYDDYAIID